jgi:hypothetical protein
LSNQIRRQNTQQVGAQTNRPQAHERASSVHVYPKVIAMKRLRNIATSTATAVAVAGFAVQSAQAQVPPTSRAVPAAAAASAPPATVGTPAQRMAMMDSQMKAMHQMHDKMTKARTPVERDALRTEHMKAMHEGMAMMGGMGSGGMHGKQGMHGMQGRGQMADGTSSLGDLAMRQQMMEKHMEMMHTTMQMMMDQMLPATKP